SDANDTIDQPDRGDRPRDDRWGTLSLRSGAKPAAPARAPRPVEPARYAHEFPEADGHRLSLLEVGRPDLRESRTTRGNWAPGTTVLRSERHRPIRPEECRTRASRVREGSAGP